MKPKRIGSTLAAAWLVLGALDAGCDEKSTLVPRTEVLVNVQADFGPELAIIEAALMDDRESFVGRGYTFVVSSKLQLPFSFAIVPAPNAPARVLVVLTGKNAAGSVLAQAKAVTTFVPSKALEIDLKLQQGCRALICEPGQTCGALGAPAGSCGPTLDAVARDLLAPMDAGATMEISVGASGASSEGGLTGSNEGGAVPGPPPPLVGGGQSVTSFGSDSGTVSDPVRDASATTQSSAECDDGRPCTTGSTCLSGKCVSVCSQKQCDPNATCALTSAGAASCNCNSGYISMPGAGGNVACLRDVACQDLGCSSDAVCEMGLDLLRHCRCKDGYTGDGRTCRDIDECANGPCGSHATCVNTAGSHTCVCEPGYTLSGSLCIDQNECLSAPCDRNALCTNLPGSYQCACKAGYDGDGRTCTLHDNCSPNPCQHGGRCTPVGFNYSCDCTSIDYDGANCENKIDDCSRTPCFNGGTCTDFVRRRSCACRSGFEGANCEINICDRLQCSSQLVCDPAVNRCRPPCYPNCALGQPCDRSTDCASNCCGTGGCC